MQDEVKPSEIKGPACLAAVELLHFGEVFEVLVVREDLDLVWGALKIVAPIL